MPRLYKGFHLIDYLITVCTIRLLTFIITTLKIIYNMISNFLNII